MSDGDRHTVSCPGNVLTLKHQVAALKIDAALTESAELMGMSTVGGVDTVA